MWYVLKSKNTLRYIVEMHLAYGYSYTHIHMHGYIHTYMCVWKQHIVHVASKKMGA